jgi:putative nucleotidyltransferase with HDIG domain
MKLLKCFWGMFNKRLSPEELKIIDCFLDDAGKLLFFQMNRVDQHHAIAVAQAVLCGPWQYQQVDLEILIKAALLHDIGKVEGDLNFWSRMAAGAARRLKPGFREKYARTTRDNFWSKFGYGFYVDLTHPRRGSYMARALGIEVEVVRLIRQHHDPPTKNQPLELTWLQAADDRN